MRPNTKLASLLLTPLSALLAGGLLLPLVLLLVYSFFRFELLEPQPGFHLEWYRAVVSDGVYRRLAVTTLLIALPVTVLTVTGGYALAYYIVFRARAARTVLIALVVTAVLGSYLAPVYAWRTLLGEHGILNSLLDAIGLTSHPLTFLLFNKFAVIVAETDLLLPFTTLLFIATLSTIQPDLAHAARDLGAGPAHVLRRVTLPLSGRTIVMASSLVFFLSCGDYLTPQLLGGPSDGTFGTAIRLQSSNTGNYPLASALAFSLVAVFAAFAVLVRVLARAFGILPPKEVA